MSYPFRLKRIDDLIEADFREVQLLLRVKYEKTYTIDYLRKVCKGHRNNVLIRDVALHYITHINEALEKIGKGVG
ncbi:MAG: hypothetical protein AAGD05_04195 [Bacteroidota bacterium]